MDAGSALKIKFLKHEKDWGGRNRPFLGME